jgi:hypothetical protein
MAVLGGAFALLTHEASHVVAAKLKGGRVLVFKPWPHFYNGKFYFGRTQTAWLKKPDRLTHIIPLYKNLLLLPLFGGLAFAWLPFLAIAGWLVVDSIWWLMGGMMGPKYDAWKYFNYKE